MLPPSLKSILEEMELPLTMKSGEIALSCIMEVADLRALKAYARTTGKTIKKPFVNPGLWCRIKLAVLKGLDLDKKERLAVLKEFGLKPKDLALFTYVATAGLERTIKTKKVKQPLSMLKMDRLLATLTPIVSTSLAKYANHKLLFIIKFYGQTNRELVYQMLEKSFAVFYRKYPFETTDKLELFMANSGRHHGLDIIRFVTRASRQNLDNDGKGKFTIKTLTFSDVARENQSYNGVSGLATSLDRLMVSSPLTEENKWLLPQRGLAEEEIEQSDKLKAVARMMRDSTKRQRYIIQTIAFPKENAEFVNFAKGYVPGVKAKDKAIAKLMENQNTFLEAVESFTGASHAEMLQTLQKAKETPLVSALYGKDSQ